MRELVKVLVVWSDIIQAIILVRLCAANEDAAGNENNWLQIMFSFRTVVGWVTPKIAQWVGEMRNAVGGTEKKLAIGRYGMRVFSHSFSHLCEFVELSLRIVSTKQICV